MSYTVVFKSSADREFENLPPQIQDRISAALAALEKTPRPTGCKKNSKQGKVTESALEIIGLFTLLMTVRVS